MVEDTAAAIKHVSMKAETGIEEINKKTLKTTWYIRMMTGMGKGCTDPFIAAAKRYIEVRVLTPHD